MSTGLLITLYCVLILAASILGGWLPTLVKLTHTRLQLASSFIGGLMLGVGLLHLLPHAWAELKSIDQTVQWFLAGFLAMFFIQRFFHYHKHDVPSEVIPGEETPDPPEPDGETTTQDLTQSCGHKHLDHHESHGETSNPNLKWSWGGAALGLTLHTLINGMALASAVLSERRLDEDLAFAGFATFLVIFLHKPFDALTISTLMAQGGWSKKARHMVNLLYALLLPVGVALFFLGAFQNTENSATFIGAGLAFAAGNFLCIAASDLLPELHFHRHDRVSLSAALLLGLALAVVVGVFESRGHDHNHHHHGHSEPNSAHGAEPNHAHD